MAGKGAPKGHPRWGGRKKGVPNKTTTALKDMIAGALQDVGGQDYLATQAHENPTAFMSLVGRTLPLQMQGDKENPIEMILRGVTVELYTKLDRLAKASAD